MDCQEAHDLMHAYLDGELDLVRSLEIERHLWGCPACAAAYANLEAVQSAIRSGPLSFQPSEELRMRVRSAVRGAMRAETRSPRVSGRSLAFAASLALVAITVWGLARGLSGPSSDALLAQELISAHVRSSLANHLTDVPSSDQHTVKPWFTGKLDFSPPVRDFTKEGFLLVGGRLDYVGGRRVAALVYRRRQHLINLFIWPDSHASDVGKATRTQQGYNLIHWVRSGMAYWAVSDLNLAELQKFVQLVQDQA